MIQAVLDLCAGLPQRSFDTGAVLLAEGTRTDALHVLIDGEVEIVKGGTPIYATTEPGAVFGEISVLLDVPHTATVKALAPCQTYFVADAAGFLRTHRDLAYLLSRMLAKRLNSVTAYLADLKAQYEDRSDHLGMVDEILDSLLHQQEEFDPGSDRYPETRI